MKILIAGSDINAKLLASYLKIEDATNDIYITTDEKSCDSSYTPINIKEYDIPAVSDFVKYNQIEFTIVTSSMAIINGIADEFDKEGFAVLAPMSEAARVTFFNGIAKKIMYKLKIPTTRFGIFDRENLAIDYVRNSKFPISVHSDFNLLSRFSYTYNNFSKAKVGIQRIFEDGNNKIVIEQYIDKDPIYMYFITDGYNAVPLASVERIESNDYTIAISPSSKISEKTTIDIMQRVIYPLLDDINKYTNMYKGIFGIKLKIQNNSFYIMEFYNGFQSTDFQSFLPVLSDNLLKIFYDTVTNGIGDNNNFINLFNNYSYTVSVPKEQMEYISEDNETDEEFIIYEDKEKYIITSIASTINKAKTKLFEYLSAIMKEDEINKLMEKEVQKELKF